VRIFLRDNNNAMYESKNKEERRDYVDSTIYKTFVYYSQFVGVWSFSVPCFV
jgi:hypothetical protein